MSASGKVASKQAAASAFRKIFRAGWGPVIGGLIPLALGVILLLTPFGKGLTNASYNLLFVPRPYMNVNEAVVVYMDDDSHEKLGQSYTAAWDRGLHAKLIDRLTEDGAKAVVFDIVFSDRMTNTPAIDERLAKAMKDSGRVCLGADFVPSGEGLAKARQGRPPFEPFADAAATIGLVELMTDDDFIVRKIFTGEPDDFFSSLSWATAEWLGLEVTKVKDPREKFVQRWINYYGSPDHIPNISYYKAVSNEQDVRPPPGFFRDKVVFVGARIITFLAGVRKDEYRSPYSFWLTEGTMRKFMAGVEIQATVFLNLLRNDWLKRVSAPTEIALVLGLGLLCGVGLVQLRPVQATVAALAAIVLTTVASYLVFKHYRIWYAWAILPAAQIPASLIWSIVFNSVNLYVQGRLMEQSLSMYVSPKRVKQLKKNPAILKPGAEKQEVSILFSDIANFTSMSEGMDSDQLADLMNSYFETSVGQCIHPTNGTVVKFIGDAIFAIWNAPEPQPHHEEMACSGALLLRDSASRFTFGKSGLTIRTRIGVHFGVANVGNFGSSTRVDYTALGENINLASRMEGLNKFLGTDLLITGDLFSKVNGKFVTRYCGRFQLKGFEKDVEVHELLAAADQAEASKVWREPFAEALARYEKKDFEAAEAGFHGVVKLRPEDGPSKFFLKHIAELRTHPPEGEWTGAVELKEK